jgi:hypothetical protein
MLNVYAGELEMRPPGAPTTPGPFGDQRELVISLIPGRAGEF